MEIRKGRTGNTVEGPKVKRLARHIQTLDKSQNRTNRSKIKVKIGAGAHLFSYAKQSRGTSLSDRRIIILPLRHAAIIHSWKFWKLFNFEFWNFKTANCEKQMKPILSGICFKLCLNCKGCPTCVSNCVKTSHISDSNCHLVAPQTVPSVLFKITPRGNKRDPNC